MVDKNLACLMSLVARRLKVLSDWDVKIVPLVFVNKLEDEWKQEDWESFLIFLTTFIEVLEDPASNSQTTPIDCLEDNTLNMYLHTFRRLGYLVESTGPSMPKSRLALISGLVVLRLIESDMFMRFYRI